MKNLKKTYFAWSMLLFTCFSLMGQDAYFAVRVSSDSILAGQQLRVEFEISNINGVFTPPDFSDFRIVSGPNTSSSFSMINGTVTQKSSYAYTLKANTPGKSIISPARVKTENQEYLTQEIEIIVLGPDEVLSPEQSGANRSREFRTDTKEQAPPGPKRKIRKI
jgi:hypothetical protein